MKLASRYKSNYQINVLVEDPLGVSFSIVSQQLWFNEAFPSPLSFFFWEPESDNRQQGQLLFPRSHLPIPVSPSFVSILTGLGGSLPLLVSIHRVILAILNFLLSKVT